VLWARQRGWLDATPSKGTTRNGVPSAKTLPPIDPLDRAISQDLMALGAMAEGPMGPMALTFRDINEWALALEHVVTGRQAELMVLMSRHYTHEFKLASNTKGAHTRPYRLSTGSDEVSGRLKGFFRSRQKGSKNG
jgi:hypothetical protein